MSGNNIRVLNNVDTSYLDTLFLENGKIRVQNADVYKEIPPDHLIIWCHKHGIYNLPTTELIDWLMPHVIPNETIEIGAGLGLGRFLGIPMTDSCYMRNNPEVRSYYEALGQPITEYPEDIIELDAVSAVTHFKPSVVIGCWITHKYIDSEHWRGGNMHGVDEHYILKNVKKYIMIGNGSVHEKKPILNLSHKTFQFPWLYSRSVNPTKNVIYMWSSDE